MSRWQEQVNRQLAELEAVQAMFSQPGEFGMEFSEHEALQAAQQLDQQQQQHYLGRVTEQAEHNQWQRQSELGGRIHLVEEDTSLRFRLPKRYPDAAPVLQVECAGSREHLEELTAAAQSGVEEAGLGMECVLLCAENLRACAQQKRQEALSRLPKQPEASRSAASLTIMRCLIWFHHIKSLTKRKHIMAWADELGIGGYSKPGFPGIIVCEGEQTDVEEYVQRIRQMRWQAMSVRAEQHDDGTSDMQSGSNSAQSPDIRADRLGAPVRLFNSTFVELSERGMDELAAACQEAGLEELFLTSMKIAK